MEFDTETLRDRDIKEIKTSFSEPLILCVASFWPLCN